MKWREAKTAEQREAALAEAMTATHYNVTKAAGLLEIDRKHLHRLLAPAAVDANLVRVSIDLPLAAKHWLERKALERKQRGEALRQAMSPIVVELVEREMALEQGRLAGARETPKHDVARRRNRTRPGRPRV